MITIMRWDLFLGCLPHTITDLKLASKLINMCDCYQTATGPEIRDLVFPGLEVLGQSNSLEKEKKIRELYANTDSILISFIGLLCLTRT